MFEKILVPLDGSTLAEQALPAAKEIASAGNARLVLFRVVPYFTVLAADPLLYEEMNRMGEDEAQAYLRATQEGIGEEVAVEVACDVGSAADAILQYAQENEIDLIVMSSHGRSGINRWVYGSVAERVLSQAPCPVLVITAGQAAWSPEVQRVLVPLDGSELAEKALTPAAELATKLGLELHLLRVVPSGQLLTETNDLADKLSTLEDKQIVEARDYVQSVSRRLHIENSHAALEVTSKTVAESIVSYAIKHDIGLIVMSSHGRTGLRRWVYGSVAEKVLRSACCATMVVRN